MKISTKTEKPNSQTNGYVFGITQVIKDVGISPERLRYWERLGIVRPKYVSRGTRKFRRYSKECIQRATLVKLLVEQEKYTLQGAIQKLKNLAYEV